MGDFLFSRILWYSNLMCRIFSCSQAFYFIGLHAIFFDKSLEVFGFLKSLTPSQELNCQPLWKCNNENMVKNYVNGL